MNFDWTPEQLEIRDGFMAFARTHLVDDVIGRDRAGEFALDLWRRCGAFGVQALPFPSRYGGRAADVLTTVLALEALAQGCPDGGLVFGIGAQMWSVQMPILRFGTDAQRDAWLPALCAGDRIGAHAMTEPDSGSDAFALTTRAVRDGDTYRLTGRKCFVSQAPVADLFLVFATIDPALGPLGITAFLVERNTPGLHVGAPLATMGLRTVPIAELVLDDCRVPAAGRLGREGRGAAIFNDSMEWERSCLMAGPVGAMARILDDAIRYVRQRSDHGSRSGTLPVSGTLAEMKVRLEASRLLLYRAAWAKQEGRDAAMDAAAAKLFISSAYVQTASDAVQLRGGHGLAVESGTERDLRDAIGSTLYSGTSDIQRIMLARGLETSTP